MPVTPTYPGVYVQEIPSGVRSIAGVSTSIGLFIARARKGPLNQAVRLFSYTEFERTFSSDTSVSTLADHVRLFFLNGGTDCYVMRIANGATFAQVTLLNETGANGVLILTAKYPGAAGQTVRADVSYGGATPELTFNMDLFREEVDAGGRVSILEVESYKNLTMDPSSYSYAVDVINSNSKLVTAALPAGLPVLVNGFSQSGVAVLHDSGTPQTLLDQWANRLGTASVDGANSFNISVDGGTFVNVNFNAIDVGALANVGDLESALADAINDALAANGQTTSSVNVELTPAGATPAAAAGATLDDGVTAADATSVLRITSNNADDEGGVLIQPASINDLAVPLGLGGAQGGSEVSAYSALRPAPTGISLRVSDPAILTQFAELTHGDLTQISLNGFDTSGAPVTVNVPINLLTGGGAVAATPLYANSEGGLRTVLTRIADSINQYKNANPLTFFWTANVVGNRLTLTSSRGIANSVGTLATSGSDLTPFFNAPNVRYYSLGSLVAAGLQTQTPAVDENGIATGTVTDGTAPTLSDYTDAFALIPKQLDLFNLMVLPEDVDPSSATVLAQAYGPASVFCQQERAFLIMDAPASWTTAQAATSGIATLRIGVVKDHSAVYFPRIQIANGRTVKTIGASGAVAGVYARIDGTRGVWKAPAGTEADIRGIVGLEQRLTDAEHGTLNPVGIDALRAFPSGLVVYGARTNDGADDFASEYKYVPVRRLALYMEESLYRGLKWVVFEPNDEPLWSQIRLNVGVFMHDLYRRGAFQGTKPSDAYFVKCDRETTTQSDINLGMVNIIVGFAPLKPAEFVVLYLQQMAGQLQV